MPVGEGTFAGWFDAEAEGNLIGAVGGEYTPAESIVLYARWEADNAEEDADQDVEEGADEEADEETAEE
jgi:hypothetical protein